MSFCLLRDGINHVNPELYTAMCMVRSRLRDSTDTIVAVTKKFDPETMVLIGQFVEPESIQLIIIGTDKRWCVGCAKILVIKVNNFW